MEVYETYCNAMFSIVNRYLKNEEDAKFDKAITCDILFNIVHGIIYTHEDSLEKLKNKLIQKTHHANNVLEKM